MPEKSQWYADSIRNTFRKFYNPLAKKPDSTHHYAGRPLLSSDQGNDRLRELVESGQAFMACRMGANELAAVVETAGCDLGVKKSVNPKVAYAMCNNAGYFPEGEDHLHEFSHRMMEDLHMADLIGVWFNYMEDFAVKSYAPQAEIAYLRALEPWYHERPWTASLKGKRVLVIHPFTGTIEAQFRRRERLFPGKEILPECSLRTVRAVVTLAGQKDERFPTWFDALDAMYQEAVREPFDLAVLGCGAYGLPLAAMLKRAGYQAVHLGGATQLLFGIKGGRWDSHPIISKLYNDAWVRPQDEEKPGGFQKVEEGCYW